jgi:glycosyltransferase involved in cell wall biosynthesis
MSSVLTDYARMPFAGYQVQFSPSYVAGSRLWSAGPFLRTLARLAAQPRARTGIVHIHLSHKGSFVREGGLAVAASRRGLPVVLTLHSGNLAEFQESHPRIVATVLRHADVIIVLGSALHQVLPPQSRGKAVIIPNAATVPAVEPAPAGSNGPTVLFAGEVSRFKGVDTLLAAWPRVHELVPDARLEIAGPTIDIVPQPLAGIEWLGPLPRPEVQRRLTTCRLAVLPSRYEGMPMFLLEAMGAARPVVATPVGEVPDLVADTGLVVEVGDAAALAAAISRLLTEPGTATRLGTAARERVVIRHSLPAVAAQLERVYDSVRPAPRRRARSMVVGTAKVAERVGR